MKPEYHEGPEAQKRFDDGMTKLFRAPKKLSKKKQTIPQPKRKKTSKD